DLFACRHTVYVSLKSHAPRPGESLARSGARSFAWFLPGARHALAIRPPTPGPLAPQGGKGSLPRSFPSLVLGLGAGTPTTGQKEGGCCSTAARYQRAVSVGSPGCTVETGIGAGLAPTVGASSATVAAGCARAAPTSGVNSRATPVPPGVGEAVLRTRLEPVSNGAASARMPPCAINGSANVIISKTASTMLKPCHPPA